MAVQRKGFSAPDDPILMKKAEKVSVKEITSPKTQKIIEKMLRFAYPEQSDRKKPVLVGLAAPQVKIPKRIILVDVKADGHGVVGDLRVYINPEIIWESKEKEEWYEGCFSTDRVCGIVSRPKSVKVRAYNREGKRIEEKHTGYVARIFQHEIDHLNGKEFVTHIEDDDKLHWVEDDEFPQYRDKEAWRNWPNKCPRERWEKIKGIKKTNKKWIEKKTWPEMFQLVIDGKKKFDARIADFEIKEGDTLVLLEWNPKTKKYTGRKLEKKVTYVLKTKEVNFWSKEEVKKHGIQIISLE